jgi:hypothetical protein
MKKRKTVRVGDFKRWLKGHANDGFGCSADECPIYGWLGREIDYDTLDKLPPWCSRFVGRWDALTEDKGYSESTGLKALEVLEEVTG